MFFTHDIYTDGSSGKLGNRPKKGKLTPTYFVKAGWAFLIVGENMRIEKCGATTHNPSMVLEQTAILKAFEHIAKDGNFTGQERFRVVTDCINTITQYDTLMQRVEYSRKTFVEVVEASDYNHNSKQFWLAMADYLEKFPVVFWHVEAHSAHAHNDRVDQLSRWAWKRPELVLREGLVIH